MRLRDNYQRNGAYLCGVGVRRSQGGSFRREAEIFVGPLCIPSGLRHRCSLLFGFHSTCLDIPRDSSYMQCRSRVAKNDSVDAPSPHGQLVSYAW